MSKPDNLHIHPHTFARQLDVGKQVSDCTGKDGADHMKSHFTYFHLQLAHLQQVLPSGSRRFLTRQRQGARGSHHGVAALPRECWRGESHLVLLDLAMLAP